MKFSQVASLPFVIHEHKTRKGRVYGPKQTGYEEMENENIHYRRIWKLYFFVQ